MAYELVWTILAPDPAMFVPLIGSELMIVRLIVMVAG